MKMIVLVIKLKELFPPKQEELMIVLVIKIRELFPPKQEEF